MKHLRNATGAAGFLLASGLPEGSAPKRMLVVDVPMDS